jgi:hypothetical protein
MTLAKVPAHRIPGKIRRHRIAGKRTRNAAVIAFAGHRREDPTELRVRTMEVRATRK